MLVLHRNACAATDGHLPPFPWVYRTGATTAGLTRKNPPTILAQQRVLCHAGIMSEFILRSTRAPVECVKSCKLIMGPVKPSPRSHLRSPRPDRASEVAERVWRLSPSSRRRRAIRRKINWHSSLGYLTPAQFA